jgi:WD40 repeat protein/serine/threonine protein kinase
MNERDIFIGAIQRDDLAQRQEFVRRECSGDDALLRRVEELLIVYEQGGTFPDPLVARPDEISDQTQAVEASGTVIGAYKLLELIGEGGMGTVWMAQQTEPVKRLVALKLIKAGMDSKQVIARFEAERQALALMDHANISRVLDAGTTCAGRPYFVMDLVKGVPITKYCDEHRLTPRQRLELFIPVCQAVQHAHQKGIIHRDLKPSNVLVAPYDGKPIVKVIDFGVAKAAGQQLTERTLVTAFGAFVGTLEYMSPEQAELNNRDIDTRSDVYALGVLLYELLAGSPPFTRQELEKAGVLEMLRIIREQEPSKPSTKLSTAEGLPTLASNRGTEPAKLTRLVRGELDWIVMKALEKDRNRRYETANSLAMDLQRYLADEPVLAYPPSVGYRVQKLLRRNWITVSLSLAALTVLAALGALAGGAKFVGQLRQEQERTQSAAARLALQHGLTLCERGESGHGLIWLARCLELAPADALDLHQAGRANLAVWLHQVQPLRNAFRQDGPVSSVAFSHDGRRLLVASHDRSVRWWDAAKGTLLTDTPGLVEREEVQNAAISPDGGALAVALVNGGMVRIYRAANGALLHELPHGAGVRAVAFHPKAGRLATASLDQHVRLWDLVTGQEIGPALRHDREARAAAFSHDGRWVLSGGADHKARVWDAETGAPVAVLPHTDEVWAIDGHPQHQRLIATACGDGKARIWDVERGRVVKEFTHREIVWTVTFSPDGRYLLTGSGDGTAQLWEVESGRPAGPPLAHRDAVWSVAFSPDGEAMATGSYDGSVRIWGVNAGRLASRELRHGGPIQDAAFSPDGELLVTAGKDGNVRRWAANTTAEIGPPLSHKERVNSIAFSPDGKTLLTGSYDHFARLWNAKTGDVIGQPQAHKHRIPAVAFRPDGQAFVTVSVDKTARLWSAATSEPIGEVMKHGAGVERAVFSPDGRWLATSCMGKRVYLWDAQSGRPLRAPMPYEAPVRALASTPDSKALVIACDNGTTQLWDTQADRFVWKLPYKERVLALAFDRAGRRLLTGAADGAARIWDAASGASLLATPMVHQDRVLAVAFSGDGETVLTGSEDRTARLWNAATGRSLDLMVRHQSKVSIATFSPDGRTILTASWDGTARLWEQPAVLEGSVARIAQTVRVWTGLEMAENEVIRVLNVEDWHRHRRGLESLGGALDE